AVAVGEARAFRRETGIVLPFRMLDHVAEPRPELLREDGDDQVAVARREGLVGDDGGVGRAERAGDAAVRPEVLRDVREERDLTVEQRQMDVGALAGSLAPDERGGD